MDILRVDATSMWSVHADTSSYRRETLLFENLKQNLTTTYLEIRLLFLITTIKVDILLSSILDDIHSGFFTRI